MEEEKKVNEWKKQGGRGPLMTSLLAAKNIGGHVSR